MIALGFTGHAIDHRIAKGRLHPLWRGVYAVGRPEVTKYGRWMAAVLACGLGAALSHESAAALWGIRRFFLGEIELSVGPRKTSRRRGLWLHRRTAVLTTVHHAIPVTTPIQTIVDLAARLSPNEIEAAISEADKLDLTDPEELRSALDSMGPAPGVGRLREVLDRRTFTLTDSELERRFKPIARRAGLALPATRTRVNGLRPDFFFSGLGLVVETDGLRYHRTPAQQTADRVRDQTYVAAGLTPLRFTHAQVRFEPQHVEAVLRAVVERLAAR